MKSIFMISLIILLSDVQPLRLLKKHHKVTLIKGSSLGKGSFGEVFELNASENSIQGLNGLVVKVIDFEAQANSKKKEGIDKNDLIESARSDFNREHEILKKLSNFKYKGEPTLDDSNESFSFTFSSKEIKRFKQLKGLPVTKLFYGTTKDNKGYLVMSKYLDFVNEYNKILNKVTPAGYYELFLEIAKAVKYAHNKNVVIKDLKPENMLLGNSFIKEKEEIMSGNKPWEVVLADFGLSCIQKSEDVNSIACLEKNSGSPTFASLEQFKVPAGTTKKSDVYTLAKVIIAFRHPQLLKFDEYNFNNNWQTLRSYLLYNKTIFIEPLNALLLIMLDAEPENRPTIEEFISKFKKIGKFFFG